ncbi:ribosome biogenesis protein Nop16 [Aspergillus coremiiformis]|uniref:Nucleolar protein 16 n=1 Tax=Aspergillus coremiiformis TaxID=138285 RepID=A0A5N6Z0E4_9EURO|nr:ribosome biogenesis protein Nop16 [Aspergillus coremiiformis]
MGNPRQKRKLKTSLPKQKPKRTGVLKSGKKKINMLGNAIIAENWDRELTLTQNYRRLGLVHRLNTPAGGSEKRPTKDGVEAVTENSLHIKSSAQAATKNIKLGETKVERDPETGKIIRVIRPEDHDMIEVAGRKVRRSNPLNDPLNDLSDDDMEDSESQKKASGNAIVKQLERQADQEGQAVKAKKPRHLSQREVEWITRLIERHGDNITAMARDMKLNPMQQTEGDLRRRIRKFKESQ